MDERNHPVLVFDGVCNLCNGFIRFVLDHERDDTIRFAASQTGPGAQIVDRHNAAHLVSDYLILIDDGRVEYGMPAVRSALARLRMPWRLLGLLTYLPHPVDDWVYRAVAHNRYRIFGRRSECSLPTEEQRRRFL